MHLEALPGDNKKEPTTIISSHVYDGENKHEFKLVLVLHKKCDLVHVRIARQTELLSTTQETLVFLLKAEQRCGGGRQNGIKLGTIPLPKVEGQIVYFFSRATPSRQREELL